jgi:ABC-type multidrug transport system fused ATPase/permease subunit
VSGPILRVVQLWQDFQQARVSIEKLGEILNAPSEPGYSGQRSNLARVHGRVTFDRVSFRPCGEIDDASGWRGCVVVAWNGGDGGSDHGDEKIDRVRAQSGDDAPG